MSGEAWTSPLRSLLRLPDLPPVALASLKREQLTEATLPIAFALMEGGFIGVIADKIYGVPPWVLAVITAAPMFGNLSSYLWNALASARRKVPFIVALQAGVLCCLVVIALSPPGPSGTWILVGSLITSRFLIAGIITVRSVIWSLNYGRAVRARTTGRLQVITSLVMVLTSALAGALLDAEPGAFRMLYLTAALLSVAGIVAFSRVAVIGEARQRVLERRVAEPRSGHRLSFLAILRNDPNYARYQLYQFLAGTANMLLEAPLIYLVSRQLQASYTASIGITLVIPFTVSLVTLPLWARYLDRVHVAEFRARQSVFWVASQLVMWGAALAGSLAGLAIGRALLGVARGGGSLAWQLGHNDFAARDQLAAYMGVHVTLTGIRGAFAPFLGITLYLGWDGPLPFAGTGPQLFGVAALLSSISWWGFRALERHMAGSKA